MNDTTSELSVRRTVTADPARAWAAFTDAGEVSRWFMTRATIDLRPGGGYRNSDGDHGKYLLVEPPRRLRFSWDNEKHCPGTVVDVTFTADEPGRTTVCLTHGGLRDREASEQMAEGWSWAMDNYAAHLEGRPPIDFDAWRVAREG